MKISIFIISLILSALVVNAQMLNDKCPTVVVVRKSLYDSFQNAKSNKESLERDLARYRLVREDLRQKYQQCEYQPDVAAFLQQAYDNVKTADTNLKASMEAYHKVEQEIRQIMGDAHDIPVVYRFYDPAYGNFGRVWTMTFAKQEGKIVIVPTYYQLPDQTVSLK